MPNLRHLTQHISAKHISANHLRWIPLLTALLGCAAFANGWEHTAIDIEVLKQALDDPNPNVRRRAAESIGYRNQEDATASLLARLKKPEPVARVRQQIFGALGMLGDAAALEAIRNCLGEETEVAVRAQCAGALHNIESADAEQLALLGVQDSNLYVRLQAINSLGSFTGSGSVKALIALTRDPEDPVRLAAILSLGRTGSPQASEVLVEVLENSENREQQQVALRALTLLANSDAFTSIKKAYEESGDETTRQYALLAMASTRAAGSESYFLEALSSKDVSTRILGLAILREYGNSSQVAAIVEQALTETGGLFVSESSELLRQVDQTVAQLLLLNEYLKTIIRLDPAAGGQLYRRAAVARSVPRTSSSELKIAQGFYQARWQSLYGLGYTADATAAEQVSLALKDEDARIRAVATRSLGVINDPGHSGLIKRMLQDDSAEVRWTAARVLGRLNMRDSADDLMLALTDAHAQVRLESTLALGFLKAQAAKSKLTQLAQTDPDPRVNEAAVYAVSLLE